MDIRKTRIEAQYNKVKELVNGAHYEDALGEISLILQEVEKIYENQPDSYNFSHILEVYFFSYFKQYLDQIKDCNVNYCDYDMNGMYRLKGSILIKLNRLEEAILSFDHALKWNPVDLDSLFEICEMYKVVGRIDSVKKIAMESYNYCCTRATMARFYRNLGFYYLEKYKPDIAIALYQYSNIYYQTESADKELAYISKALGKTIDRLSVTSLQETLNSIKIPSGPNPDTLGIAYRVGHIMLDEGDKAAAGDCFTMVYDLTMDEEIKTLLEKCT